MDSEFSINNEIQNQRAMFETIQAAVDAKDYEFASQVAGMQTLVRPFEVAKWMQLLLYSHQDNPDTKRHWENALRHFLQSLNGQEFPVAEVDIMQDIASQLNQADIDSQKQKEQFFTDHEFLLSETNDSDDDHWEKTIFKIQITQQELAIIRQLSVYKLAKQYAKGQLSADGQPDLTKAIESIYTYCDDDLAAKLRIAIDRYVYAEAKQYAKGQLSADGQPDLTKAEQVIIDFASSDEIATKMMSSIDKFVYQQAKQYAKGQLSADGQPDLTKAKRIIVNYASTPGRRDAMLRRMGFIS